MIVHGLFAECVNRAPGLIFSNVNYVKKVVFPLEIIPCVAMGSALFHATIRLAVPLIAQLILTFSLPWTAVFFPLVILPLLIAIMGFAWALSATGVFVRDSAQTTGSSLRFCCLYRRCSIPFPPYRRDTRDGCYSIRLPFVTEEAQNVLVWGRMLGWTGWGLSLTVGMAIAWGCWWFPKARNGFVDVL